MLRSVLFLAAVLAALASRAVATPAPPDFMTDYISKRAAVIAKERAKLEADLDAAAKAAAAIAASPRYQRPIVKAPVGSVNYVDLSRVGLRAQATTGGLNFNSGGRCARVISCAGNGMWGSA